MLSADIKIIADQVTVAFGIDHKDVFKYGLEGAKALAEVVKTLKTLEPQVICAILSDVDVIKSLHQNSFYILHAALNGGIFTEEVRTAIKEHQPQIPADIIDALHLDKDYVELKIKQSDPTFSMWYRMFCMAFDSK